MIVTCENCAASLQIDETKATSQRFSIRCPKCQSLVPVDLRNSSPSASSNWSAPSAATYRNAKPKANGDVSSSADSNNLLRVLAAALQSQSNNDASSTNRVQHQPQKRALVCLNGEQGEATAGLLDQEGYTVFVAENPAQATEKIRDQEVDILIFAPDFALKFSGASVLQQMINTLNGAERRKLFAVSIEESTATFSSHEAFLRNLNLIVNNSDLHHLPSILHRALREYNELYRYYNQAATA